MGKKKLFIIDDEEEIVTSLSARFAAEDWLEVAGACDPESGLTQLKTFAPDVVLLDILLPKMDGWELCRLLREDPATHDVSIFVMTGIMSKALIHKAYDVKAHVITKPLSEREIAKVLAAADGAPK